MGCQMRVQVSQDESEWCGSKVPGGMVDGKFYCKDCYEQAKKHYDKRQASLDDAVVVNREGERIRFDGSYYIHVLCNGFVDLKKVSETQNVLLCRACCLRIHAPNTLDTWEKLKPYLFHKGAM